MKFYAKISYWDVLSAFYTTPNTSKNDDKNVINFYTYEYWLSELLEIIPPPAAPTPSKNIYIISGELPASHPRTSPSNRRESKQPKLGLSYRQHAGRRRVARS